MPKTKSDRIKFNKGQGVKIDGIPFELESDTVLIGNANNLKLISDHRSFGVPSVLTDDQSETSDTMSPSSESI